MLPKHTIRGALFVALGSLCIMSCQKKPKYDFKKGTPDYSAKAGENILRIGAWVAPPPANWNGKGNPNQITQKNYDDIAASGINIIYSLYEMNNLAATQMALEYAENAGIRYLARDTATTLDPVAMEMEPGEMHQKTKAYDGMSALSGWLVQDEPGARDFEKLGRIREFFEAEYPGKEFYVNLFPTYANPSQTETDSYERYIDDYLRIVKPPFLSYDHYCMMVDGYGNKKMTEDVLWNLELVANKCKQAGIPMYTFVQAMSFSEDTRVPNEAEIRHQVLTQLAYGSRSIQYFCYWTPLEFTQGSPSMITIDGQKTAIYDHVKKVNSELLSLDEAYLDFDWVETLPVKGSEVRDVVKQFRLLEQSPESLEAIASIEASQNTLVGHFKDHAGRDGFLVTNFSDPAINAEDKVTIDFSGAKKALVYHGTSKEVVSLKKGVYETAIAAGDGVFVIPFAE